MLFLTTNHPERLDPALIRPGRVDRRIQLGNTTPDQARRLFVWFFQGCGLSRAELESPGRAVRRPGAARQVCMAAIQEHLLRHRGAPEAAAHEADFDDPASDLSRAR